ncbi:MAG: cation diffusion facilitator family transporter [Cyanobacteria bacterium]|nr:cation diffusion facilitator family transporter [Cyanobacteriota bacterium]
MPQHHDHHHSSAHTGHSQAGHSHSVPDNYNAAFLVGLLLNGGFVLAEFGFGVQANSVSLMADAGHNLGDVLGLILAWSGTLLTRRKPSARYTYGWRKSSILAAFLNAIFLLITTGFIVWESFHRLMQAGEVNSPIVIAVALVGIGINAGTAAMFLSGRKGDLNIRAAFQHMVADAVISLGVVLAGIVILFTHWLWLDPVFSLVISTLIIFSTWELLKDSFRLAIDGVPSTVDERAVRGYLCERPGVTQVHDLHIWSMSTIEMALTVHLVMPYGHPSDHFLAEISRELKFHFGIQHSTIQIERGDADYPCSLDPSCSV